MRKPRYPVCSTSFYCSQWGESEITLCRATLSRLFFSFCVKSVHFSPLLRHGFVCWHTILLLFPYHLVLASLLHLLLVFLAQAFLLCGLQLHIATALADDVAGSFPSFVDFSDSLKKEESKVRGLLCFLPASRARYDCITASSLLQRASSPSWPLRASDAEWHHHPPHMAWGLVLLGSVASHRCSRGKP